MAIRVGQRVLLDGDTAGTVKRATREAGRATLYLVRLDVPVLERGESTGWVSVPADRLTEIPSN